MKREFNFGDIAHLSKGKRVRGILNHLSENEKYKDFTLRFKDEVKILDYTKADEKICGGYVYKVEVEYNGTIYIIENISQFELIPKEMWKQSILQEKQIFALENEHKFIKFKDKQLQQTIEVDFNNDIFIKNIVKFDKLDLQKSDSYYEDIQIVEWDLIDDTFYAIYRVEKVTIS